MTRKQFFDRLTFFVAVLAGFYILAYVFATTGDPSPAQQRAERICSQARAQHRLVYSYKTCVQAEMNDPTEDDDK